MQTAHASFEAIKKMAEIGNPNTIPDVGVAALCARTAVIGAFLNLKINCNSLDDKSFVNKVISKGQKMADEARSYESEVLNIVNKEL